jgi:hypothetical protein
MLYNGNDQLVLTNTIQFNAFLKQHLFILGAADPEMDRIERALVELSAQYIIAEVDGKRVNPGNAYKMQERLPKVFTPIFVECGGTNEYLAQYVPFVKIDHHNPGDFGFDKGPDQYWEGSSLGQLYRLLLANGASPCVLDMAFGEDRYYIAASDHCPSYAYRGLCPGIDPDFLKKSRAVRQADFNRMGLKEYLEKLDESIEKAYSLPTMELGGEAFLIASEEIFMLNEVSLILGLPVQYTMKPNARESRIKIGLLGGSPSLIQSWMEYQQMNLINIYGSPERGYAGGYLPE